MSSATVERPQRGYAFWQALPFWLMHLACLAVIWTGFSWQALALCVALYLVRMFAVTGAYHRYFSHRTYKTSRPFQFVLAWLAQSSMQKGALWWAAHHRTHHKYSDLPGDLHSAKLDGFWYSHVGWILDFTSDTDYAKIRDLSKYKELVWLNRYHLVPPLLLAGLCYLALGLPGLVVGFVWSTVLLWHGTFVINSLAHVIGTRRFDTTDESKNNFWLALVTLGEGWHNNHHHYMGSTRQGFYWWELDVTYYVLKGLERVGLVWELREPPPEVLAEGRARDRAKKRRDETAPTLAPTAARKEAPA